MKTFYEALDEYLIIKEKTLKEYSFQGVKFRVKRLKEMVADIELNYLDTEEIQEYVDEWQKKYSAATIKAYLVIIKEVLKTNGFHLNEIKIQNSKPKRLRLYSEYEIELLEKCLSRIKVKYNHLAIPIAMYTGLRIGEILALQWLDVDLNRRLISVSKNSVRIKGKGTITQEPKTQSSIREIAIPQQLYDILIKFQPKEDEDWSLFVTSNKEKPQSTRTAQRSAERIFAIAGVEYKGFHSFRHSYATKMVEKGIPVKAISDLLGHSNINTTLNIYSHTSNDFKKECVDKVFEDKNYEYEKRKEQDRKELYQQILEMQKTMNELLIKVSSL